jgi:hypothetical protein
MAFDCKKSNSSFFDQAGLFNGFSPSTMAFETKYNPSFDLFFSNAHSTVFAHEFKKSVGAPTPVVSAALTQIGNVVVTPTDIIL